MEIPSYPKAWQLGHSAAGKIPKDTMVRGLPEWYKERLAAAVLAEDE